MATQVGRGGGGGNVSGGKKSAGRSSDRDNAMGGGRGDGRGAGPQGRASPSQTGRPDGRLGRAEGGTKAVGNDTTATALRAQQAGVSPDQYSRAVSAYAGRVRDKLDSDNSALDDFGNVLAGLAGFHEMEPEFDVNDLNPSADWGFDVVGALAGAAGMALGIPGLGLAADAAEDLLGNPATLNMGTDVLDFSEEEDPLGYPGGDVIDPGADVIGGVPADSTAGVDAVFGDGGGTGNGIDAALDELLPARDEKKPPKPKPPKPPKPYSNVLLGDVVSVLDLLEGAA